MTVALEDVGLPEGVVLQDNAAQSPESPDAQVLRGRILQTIERHFSATGRGDRPACRRAIFRVFADRPMETLSLKDVVNASGVKRNTALKALHRLVELTDEWADEYGFRIILEYVRSEYSPPAIRVRAELADTFSPTACRRVSTCDRYRPTIPFELTDEVRRHVRFLLESRGIPHMPVCDEPPSDAGALVDNSTWVLYQEFDEIRMMREILANARRGRATSTFRLKSKSAVPSGKRAITNRMEAKTVIQALKLGFFVEVVRGQMGYIFPFFLDPKVRRELLLGRNLATDTMELPFFDEVRPFSFREFKRRLPLPRVQETLQTDRHLPAALYTRVAKDQSQGIYRTGPEWASQMGLCVATFWQLIRDAQRIRHERGFYLRYRSDNKVELVLL